MESMFMPGLRVGWSGDLGIVGYFDFLVLIVNR